MRVLYLIVFAVLILAVAADTDLQTSCVSEIDCSYCPQYGFTCYCNPATLTCFAVSEQQSISTPPPDSTLSSNLTSSNSTSSPASALPVTISPDIETLKAKVAGLESASSAWQQQLQGLESKLNQHSSTLSALTVEQERLQQELGSELHSVATGLAGLQENVVETQTDLATIQQDLAERPTFTKLIISIVVLAVLAALVLGILYYNKYYRQPRKELHPHIIQYITHHIKAGKKFAQIRENLQKAGWHPQDIAWAYKETAKRNYGSYAGAAKTYDQKKVLMISVFAVLLILGLVFIIRGVSTGQAIHFQSEIELDAAVKSLLTNQFDENQFYPLIDSGRFCFEVVDASNRVSYSVVKTPAGHTVEKLLTPCTEDLGYDASLLFTNWDDFNIALRKPSCENFRNAHKEEDGQRGMYVLPSKYILPGFKKNPFADTAPYCTVLATCLGPIELEKVGC